MTNAYISDTTGKTIKKEQAYKVSVYSYGSKVHLDLDTEFVEELKTLVALARQNGCEWYELVKKDDKWVREETTHSPKPIKGGTENV
jgi:hypothetical protein